MTGHFELKRGADGRFLFNLKAGNGEIILTSGVFASKGAASTGIEVVKASAPNDKLYERKIATNKKPYFILKSANGEVLGRSEMYSSTTTMENGIKSVMRNAVEAPVRDLAPRLANMAAR